MGDDVKLAELNVMLKMFIESTGQTFKQLSTAIDKINEKLENSFVTKESLTPIIDKRIDCKREEAVNNANSRMSLIRNIKDIVVTIGIFVIALYQAGVFK